MTLFIGQCQDINDMLGVPTSPVSPGVAPGVDSAPFAQQEPPKAEPETTEDKVRRESTYSFCANIIGIH